jgi:hypothetical protein
MEKVLSVFFTFFYSNIVFFSTCIIYIEFGLFVFCIEIEIAELHSLTNELYRGSLSKKLLRHPLTATHLKQNIKKSAVAQSIALIACSATLNLWTSPPILMSYFSITPV